MANSSGSTLGFLLTFWHRQILSIFDKLAIVNTRVQWSSKQTQNPEMDTNPHGSEHGLKSFFFDILTRTNLGHLWHASKTKSKCTRSMILQTDAKFSRGGLGNSTSNSLTWSSRERIWPQDYKENVNSILRFDESKSNLVLTQKNWLIGTRLLGLILGKWREF